MPLSEFYIQAMYHETKRWTVWSPALGPDAMGSGDTILEAIEVWQKSILNAALAEFLQKRGQAPHGQS